MAKYKNTNKQRHKTKKGTYEKNWVIVTTGQMQNVKCRCTTIDDKIQNNKNIKQQKYKRTNEKLSPLDSCQMANGKCTISDGKIQKHKTTKRLPYILGPVKTPSGYFRWTSWGKKSLPRRKIFDSGSKLKIPSLERVHRQPEPFKLNQLDCNWMGSPSQTGWGKEYTNQHLSLNV